MNRRKTVISVLGGLVGVAVIALLGLNAIRSGRAEEGPPILQYPSFPPTPTVGAPPTSAPSVAGARLAAYGFDSADALSKWQIVDPADIQPEQRSNWAVEDGALVQKGTGPINDPSIQESMAVTGDPSWTNYTISAKVYDQNNVTFGLVARRQGNSFYRYYAIPNSNDATPKQVLEKVVKGVATPLATRDKPGYDQRKWHVVSMSVVGSQIRVTLDGTVVAEATDSTLSSGQAGLFTRAIGGIRFDDVTITGQ